MSETAGSALKEQLNALLNLLEQERQALIGRDSIALADIVPRKQALCERIARRLPAAEIAKKRQWESDLESAWRKCQELNAVNGALVQRARQSNRELLHLLRGGFQAPLYGADGITERRSNTGALTRA